MNGVHDMGGMHGFGPVHPERDEPPFHASWERRVFAATLAMGATGRWNIDMARSARESMSPSAYLASTYYEIWCQGLGRLLVATGLCTAEELRDGRPRVPPVANVSVLAAVDVAGVLSRGGPTARDPAAPARFAPGQVVRARSMNPPTHTRLPRYCRGRRGTIMRLHGVHVFPDANATGGGENPQWLYNVRFDARELWGADTTAAAVFVDCWEPYLEAV
jgi:nitrile hydratase beta subunit